MYIKLKNNKRYEVLDLYLGLLRHGNTHKLGAKVVENLGCNNRYDIINFV